MQIWKKNGLRESPVALDRQKKSLKFNLAKWDLHVLTHIAQSRAADPSKTGPRWEFTHCESKITLSFLSLLFWNSLFFPLRGNLCSFKRFSLLFQGFRGSVGIENPCFFGGFPCLFFSEKARKGRTGHLFFDSGDSFLTLVGGLAGTPRRLPRDSRLTFRAGAAFDSCSWSAGSCNSEVFLQNSFIIRNFHKETLEKGCFHRIAPS